MKNIRILPENIQFLVVKFSIYLNRRVFVMKNEFNRDYMPERAGNFHMNNAVCHNNELVQDFIAVLITCKSNENPIAIIRTTFLKVYKVLKSG